MWLSKKHAGGRSLAASVGTASIGGEAASAVTQTEQRGLPVFAPGGYCWRPGAGESLLVIKCGEFADYPVVAAAAQPQAPEDMQTGEVCILSAGGAQLWLKNDGSIDITGELRVNGEIVAGGN